MPNVAEKFAILAMLAETPYSHENQPRIGKEHQLSIISVVMRVADRIRQRRCAVHIAH